MGARPSSARPKPIRLRYPLVRRPSLRFKIRSMARWLALIAITQQISCGGGTASNPSASVVSPPVASVNISPPSAQIAVGASVQFTATVQNASNVAVAWQVNGIPGGNSSAGTIVASSAATASYTAPASVSGALTVTVAAVLQADATKSASASVTITPLPVAQVSVSPANASVATGASLQFTANVQNAGQAVIWEVNNIQGGSAVFGRITSSGFYSAPPLVPNLSVVTITAFLFSDSSVTGSTNLTIVPPVPSVSISPSTANVVSGQTFQFSAAVQNSSAGVIWQVNGTPAGNAVTGTITSSGLYTAPTSLQNLPMMVTITAVLQTSGHAFASAGVTIIAPGAFAGVYSWRNDNSLTGQNAQEIALTPSSVTSTTSPIFGKLVGCPVDGAIFAQPLYVPNVTIANVAHNVVYVATEHDTVYAFDADNLCNQLWQVSFLDSVAGVTSVPATDIPGQTDILPEIGITGTPVIDPVTATLYVVAKTKGIQNGSPVYMQQLHALDLATGWVAGTAGTEKFGAPAVTRAVGGGPVFDPLGENQRSALLLAGGKIYVAFDSYGDTGLFHGWLFAYNAANLRSAPGVFNSTPNGSSGGIGESGAAPSSDSSANVFVATSKGTPFDPNLGGDYPQTLLKLQISSASPVVDYFTPWNQATLNFTRKNFGSTGVLLLPDSAGSAAHPHLAVAGSEAGSLYLVDRDHLGGFSSVPNVDNVVQTLCPTVDGTPGSPASILGTPAFWVGNTAQMVYVAAADDTLKAFSFAGGIFSSPSCSSGAAVPLSRSAGTFPLFGASPVISWDGTNPGTGIVWALDTSGYTGNVATSSPAILHAYDATNLSNELYVSASTANGPLPPAGPAVKFAVPTVAKGKVYVGSQNELSVFGLQ